MFALRQYTFHFSEVCREAVFIFSAFPTASWFSPGYHVFFDQTYRSKVLQPARNLRTVRPVEVRLESSLDKPSHVAKIQNFLKRGPRSPALGRLLHNHQDCVAWVHSYHGPTLENILAAESAIFLRFSSLSA